MHSPSPRRPWQLALTAVTLACSLTLAFFTACGTGSSAGTIVLGDGGTGLTCTASQKMCGTSCASVQVDPANCGACGKVCMAGLFCSAGACVSACGASSTQCGQSCVDTTSDNANCGACGKACGAGATCAAGSCSSTVSPCGAGSSMCGSACVDTNVDPANCGSCGKACAAGQECVKGACAGVCGSGTYCAGQEGGAGYCAETMSDNANCGGCGHACAASESCVSGVCSGDGLRCGDGGGSTLCRAGGEAGAAYCADTNTDNDNCGTCGTACKAGTLCVAGKCDDACASIDGGTETLCTPVKGAPYCANTQTDNANCGACGTVCAAGTACEGGKCGNACASADGGTETLCTPAKGPSYCANTQTDNVNCGACGTVCGADTTCDAGKCVPCVNVLYINTATTAPTGVIAGIMAKAPSICQIDYYNANNGTPNLQLLAPYTVVLATNDESGPFSDPTGLGNLLYAYFNGGGQVVVTLFADAGYAIGGSFASTDLLMVPVNAPTSSDSFSSTAPAQDLVPASAVLAGVKSITGSGWHGPQALQHGGVAVADWASGDILAVTGVITDTNGKKRNRVDLNVLPTDIGAGAWTGDAFQLVANAILYK